MDISATDVRRAGLALIVASHWPLSILRLNRCTDLTPHDAMALVRRTPGLRELSVVGCTRILPSDIVSLQIAATIPTLSIQR